MKILFCSYGYKPNIGGIETVSEILVSYFVKQGHEVILVTLTEQKYIEDDHGNLFKIYRAPSSIKLIQLYAWADVIYQNHITLRFLWPMVFFFNKPLVIAIRTWIEDSFLGKLKRWILSRSTAVIANSEAVRRREFKDAIVIGNPYEDSLFRRVDSVERDKALVFLGRLVSDKGADILLSAFSELIKDSLFFEQTKKFKFSFTLSIIGDGPELLNLKEHAEKLKVAHLVSFVGPLKGEQLVQKLNEHQILVVPSIWEEPFGVVALEGAACGCLVVGSSGGGLVDAIGDSGLLFKRGDIGDLVLMLKKAFYFSENQKEVLSKKRREKLLNHTQDAVGLRYLQVIEKAFNNKKLVYES